MAVLLISFLLLMVLGCPIAFCLLCSGTLYFISNDMALIMLVQRLTEGANTFTLLAVPGFILAGNLMNSGEVTDRIFDFCGKLVGHITGGLAHANILVSMIFAGISGSSQADTAGVGKILIPAMEKQGYDKQTAVGVTAASSTLGSIIPPSITMVVFAGIANVGTGALFMTGLIPGIMLGLAMMGVVVFYSKKKNFPKGERIPTGEILDQVWSSLPALMTPVILIGGIVTGWFTPTESAAVACVYALIIGIFFYKTIKIRRIPAILVETMKLSSLSLFALATANALGELLSYYQLNAAVQGFFVGMPGGKLLFLVVVVLFFMFVGTFMDAVPAMILFVPIILPSAAALGISPIILGLIVVVTLALGLVTPPYGLCLLLAGSISGISIEDSFKGVLPYFLSSLAVLVLMMVFSDVFLAIPTALFPNLF